MSDALTDQPVKRQKLSWLRILFRWFLLLIIGVALGAGIFFGASYLANNYFATVESNTESINLLTTQLEQMDTQISSRLDDLVTRLDTLELQSDTSKLTLAELQTSVTDLETNSNEISDRVEILETDTASLADSLADQDELTTALKTQIAELDETLSDEQTNLDQLTVQVSSMTTVLDEWNLSTSRYESSLKQIKALVLLSRAQLYISQNNFGLARQDVASAYEVIEALNSNSQTDTAQPYTAILSQLDSALLNLPSIPISANTEIEGAWNNLWAMIETDFQAQSST